MSGADNIEALINQGEFHAKKPRPEPMTTKGHAPGVQVGNDAAPEFHIQPFPPGTAPPEDSFRPNPVNEVPGQANNPAMNSSMRADPLDFPGATSGDVHNATTIGKPVQGQTSQELHGGHRKKERSGLEGVGASSNEGTVQDKVRQLGADLDDNVQRGSRGKSGSQEGGYDAPGVEGAPTVSADELAAERR